MNVADLKALIEDLDDETEVRIMHQYNWPFEYSISNGILATEIINWQLIEDEPLFVPSGSKLMFDPEGTEPVPQLLDKNVLYLTDGTQLGYGTKEAWQDR